MPLAMRDLSIRYGFFVLLIALAIFFFVAQPAFLSLRSMIFVFQSVSITAILALGVTATLVVGGFDLSIGSVAASSMMAASYAMVIWGWGTPETVALCIGFGLLVGLINGLIIVYGRVPDLLATLGTMFLLLGLQLVPTAGRSIAKGMLLPDGSTATGSFDKSFLALGRSHLFHILPISVIVMLALAAVIFVFLEFTRFGRVMYAIGSNEQASRLAGAPVARYKIGAYMISGGFAAIGGILLAARVGRGDVSSGNNLLLDAVAAALIGFAVLGVAKPNAFGTLIGALFVGMLLQGLTMMNAPYYTQDAVKGAVLVVALLFTFSMTRRAGG
ncbi:ABC transporter permease [Aurantimonas sp. VKM B-3413]|uniref:ABC transporter permease n=1 Tax=Aurantimonas sp. VKM B-3413 TaxID=2779401 RepID=UPI001E485CDA|nr:ABC transporter permease [Aurantimonas sp. VKM B-3413]MCB8836402.1 ABC transporter permease [Aurantimonas sp. VKM B-3413]